LRFLITPQEEGDLIFERRSTADRRPRRDASGGEMNCSCPCMNDEGSARKPQESSDSILDPRPTWSDPRRKPDGSGNKVWRSDEHDPA
jgi:hypothetical protein